MSRQTFAALQNFGSLPASVPLKKALIVGLAECQLSLEGQSRLATAANDFFPPRWTGLITTFNLPNPAVHLSLTGRFAYPQQHFFHPLAPNRAPVQVAWVGRAVLNQKQNRSIGKAVSAAEGATAPLMSLCPVTYPAPSWRGLQAV